MYQAAGFLFFLLAHIGVILAYGIVIGRIWAKGGANKWMGITVMTMFFFVPITWLAHMAFPNFGASCFNG